MSYLSGDGAREWGARFEDKMPMTRKLIYSHSSKLIRVKKSTKHDTQFKLCIDIILLALLWSKASSIQNADIYRQGSMTFNFFSSFTVRFQGGKHKCYIHGDMRDSRTSQWSEWRLSQWKNQYCMSCNYKSMSLPYIDPREFSVLWIEIMFINVWFTYLDDEIAQCIRQNNQ